MMLCPGLDSTWPPLPPDSCDVSRSRAPTSRIFMTGDITLDFKNMTQDILMILGSSFFIYLFYIFLISIILIYSCELSKSRFFLCCHSVMTSIVHPVTCAQPDLTHDSVHVIVTFQVSTII